jgi:Dynein heavy chain AAA lid domain
LKKELPNYVNLEMLKKDNTGGNKKNQKLEKQIDGLKLEHIYVMCAVWAFGGILTWKDNADFRK